MRTLTEMLTNVQRYLADTDAAAYTETLLKNGYMPDAAAMLWEDILSSPRARRMLYTESQYTAMTAEQELYDLPEDCLRVESVQVRHRDSDERPETLVRREPPGAGFYPRNGSEAYFGGTAVSLHGAVGLYWYDDCPPHQVRIWPELNSVNEEKYRFRYYAEPEFPTDDAGTFNDPGNSGSDSLHLPDGIDAAVEFLTAALAGVEEAENGRPIGTFGQLYRSRLESLKTRGDRSPPRRRYIQTGRRK